LSTTNLFRMRALCASLIVLLFAGALAFSAAPRLASSQEKKQSNSPGVDVDSAELDSYQGQYATDANPDSPASFSTTPAVCS